MFERNKIDNVEHAGVPVELTLAEGETLKGRIMVAMGRNMFEVLNSAGGFLEFQPYGGERTYIAKAAIRDVRLTNVPRAENLALRLADPDGFDPHAVLGLARGASIEDVKAAWHRLAKAYHPDRYSSADLPPEVRSYLAAMARRINAAYAALEVPLQASKRAAAQRATPVYTSGAGTRA